MRLRHLLLPVVGIAALCAVQPAVAEPSGVECIAPSDPGGGWDFTCRQVGKNLQDLGLVDGGVQVTNMSGGDGGVAFSYVASKRSKDPNLLIAASTAAISNLAEGRYVGLSADNVRWLASLGADFGVIAVSKDSKYTDLKSLMDAVKANPSKVSFGGGSVVGAWDDLKVLLLAKAAGVEDLKSVKYIAFNSGGPAMTQLLGNHIDAYTGDFSEVVGQMQAGDVRILAVLAPERLDIAPDVPTAKEQGFDVIGPNWRGFYVPKDISDADYQTWVGIMKKLYDSDEWKTAMKNHGLAPFFNSGSEFDDFVHKNVEDLKQTAVDAGVLQ